MGSRFLRNKMNLSSSAKETSYPQQGMNPLARICHLFGAERDLVSFPVSPNGAAESTAYGIQMPGTRPFTSD